MGSKKKRNRSAAGNDANNQPKPIAEEGWRKRLARGLKDNLLPSVVLPATITLLLAAPAQRVINLFYPPEKPTKYLLFADTRERESHCTGKFKVFLGSNAWSTNVRGRFVIVQVDGKPAIELEYSDRGLNLYGVLRRASDGMEVARIEGSEITLNPATAFRVNRSDSKLSVFDSDTGEVLLFADFVNERTFELQGTLATTDLSVIVDISKTEVRQRNRANTPARTTIREGCYELSASRAAVSFAKDYSGFDTTVGSMPRPPAGQSLTKSPTAVNSTASMPEARR